MHQNHLVLYQKNRKYFCTEQSNAFCDFEENGMLTFDGNFWYGKMLQIANFQSIFFRLWPSLIHSSFVSIIFNFYLGFFN